MRLLRCSDLEFEEFFDSETPPYAILSHTWERDQEISYSEANLLINDGGFRGKGSAASQKIRIKSGMQKILNFVDQAVRQGLRYAWVDTCSIDKSSSADLSEAINSMFQWYKNAAVCIVYLADLEPSAEWKQILGRFRFCRWHKRGWCLQELLAPANVQFYCKDWSYFGHKAKFPGLEKAVNYIDLSSSISNITGIPTRFLRNGDLTQASIAKKMSWAARRKTSRVEDMAYCLLGLFDINMPLLYGEGSRAFTRLQEEIIRRSDDQSIFAWENVETEDDERRFSGMLAPSVESFAGSGHIVPKRTSSTRIPYVLTNIGLQISMRTQQLPESILLGVLECENENDSSLRYCISLAEPWTFESNLFIMAIDGQCDLGSRSGMPIVSRDNKYRNPLGNFTISGLETKLVTMYIVAQPASKLPTKLPRDQKTRLHVRKIPHHYKILAIYPQRGGGGSLIPPWLFEPDAKGWFGFGVRRRGVFVTNWAVVMIRLENRFAYEATCSIISFRDDFQQTWSLTFGNTSPMLQEMHDFCVKHGKLISVSADDYNEQEPSHIAMGLADCSFGQVVVVDLYEKVLGSLVKHLGKKVPASTRALPGYKALRQPMMVNVSRRKWRSGMSSCTILHLDLDSRLGGKFKNLISRNEYPRDRNMQ